MDKITIRHLRYVEAVARHRHFGKAASACAISQPALSMQVGDLESILGATLFERSSRQIRLTPFGRTFLHKAEEILRSMDELGDIARSANSGIPQDLRIGIIPTIAPYLLPEIIRVVTHRYPQIHLEVRETQTRNLIDELNEGQLDIAIVALPVSESNLLEVALFSETFVLVRPRSGKHEPVPDKASLSQMRLLLLEEGHCFREQALDYCSIGRSSKRQALNGSSLSTLVQMVGSGMGVTLIPEMAVEVETRSADVSVARFAAPAPGRTVGMIWRKSNPLSDRFTEIADVVRAIKPEKF